MKYNYLGFSCLRRDRSSGRGGGIAFYIRRSLSFCEVEDLISPDESVELSGISLNSVQPSIAIIACYRSPGKHLTQEQWDRIAQNLTSQQTLLIENAYLTYHYNYSDTISTIPVNLDFGKRLALHENPNMHFLNLIENKHSQLIFTDGSKSTNRPSLDSERGAVRRVASVGFLPSGSTLKRPVIQVQRPLRRAVVLSDSPPVRSSEKPPPPSRSSPSVAPTDPPSTQLPTKRPVIQVHRPLRRAVVLSDSPPVRCLEKPKSLPPPVTVPTPEELPCIRQLTRPVLVTPEQRPPACETPGKRQPLPPRPAGRELDTLPESFHGLAIRTPKLRLNDDVPASDPSHGTRDLRDRLNELRLAPPSPSRPRSIRRRRGGKYKTRSTLRRDRARLRPLCMLDTAGKILERLICDRLEAITESPGGLSDHQYGFQKGRSTINTSRTSSPPPERPSRARDGTAAPRSTAPWNTSVAPKCVSSVPGA
ncbi:unnamed protein product [Trichogramma brassicae]|uniref:Reverse transcriptase domain-containing protein n=1 Tax=Trichogramma brassicae TaxID=86971 RepID=A0A6H5IK52_9HYME|nr:unnamed protein product [Trichogramma brassicae]